MKRRAFGEVWLGREKTSKTLVAIKRVKNKEVVSEINAKTSMCDLCTSTFVVGLIAIQQKGSELWVRLFPMWINCSWWRSTVVEALLVIA